MNSSTSPSQRGEKSAPKFTDSHKTLPNKPKSKRLQTIYGAVAGQLTSYGFLNNQLQNSPNIKPLTPRDALFRKRSMRNTDPECYKLQSHQALPDSDLLKDIHAYATDFYATLSDGHGERVSSRSLDETALLAVGILLEEMCEQALGDNGDMVFTQGMDEEGTDYVDEDEDQDVAKGTRIIGRVVPAQAQEYENSESSGTSEDEILLEESPKKKRRRVLRESLYGERT